MKVHGSHGTGAGAGADVQIMCRCADVQRCRDAEVHALFDKVLLIRNNDNMFWFDSVSKQQKITSSLTKWMQQLKLKC